MSAREILSVTEHRPYPLPSGPWIMRQTWHDLLFAHWAFTPDAVRATMPGPLREHLDLFGDKAYVGVIPFWMSGVRARWMPPAPTVSRFPELNVRTYVTLGGRPGVYFFSLDAASLLAVLGARVGFALRYFWAEMRCDVGKDGVRYASRRGKAEFRGWYQGVGPAARNEPGSLEHFLTERYCLYAVRGRKAMRADIHHHPWPLQAAEARIEVNTMAEASGIALVGEPLLHYAKRMDVLVWRPQSSLQD